MTTKPISTTITTNFEPNKAINGRDDCSTTLIALFCVVVAEFSVNGNQAYTANAKTTTRKQSYYKVEQSSFTLIALFSLKIGRCRGRNWLNWNQALWKPGFNSQEITAQLCGQWDCFGRNEKNQLS